MAVNEFKVWDLFLELRKELVESQKIRAQVIGFKVTAISTAMGILVANSGEIDEAIFVVPAFAAVFFDCLIYSYSFSIKRIGFYIRYHIEPELKGLKNMPRDFTQWQQFLTDPERDQKLSTVSNFGLTAITIGVAIPFLIMPFRPFISTPLLATLVLFLILDIYAIQSPKKFKPKPQKETSSELINQTLGKEEKVKKED